MVIIKEIEKIWNKNYKVFSDYDNSFCINEKKWHNLIWKEAQKELLQDLSNQFQPDVRIGMIYNENLNEWIQNKQKEIENDK